MPGNGWAGWNSLVEDVGNFILFRTLFLTLKDPLRIFSYVGLQRKCLEGAGLEVVGHLWGGRSCQGCHGVSSTINWCITQILQNKTESLFPSLLQKAFIYFIFLSMHARLCCKREREKPNVYKPSKLSYMPLYHRSWKGALEYLKDK